MLEHALEYSTEPKLRWALKFFAEFYVEPYAFRARIPMISLAMEVEALIWVLLPVFVAAGSACLTYSIMQARLEVAVAKERAQLAEAQASIQTYKITLEERIRATEEETRRNFQDALAAHFEVMREIGEPIPEPRASVDYVEVAAQSNTWNIWHDSNPPE